MPPPPQCLGWGGLAPPISSLKVVLSIILPHVLAGREACQVDFEDGIWRAVIAVQDVRFLIVSHSPCQVSAIISCVQWENGWPTRHYPALALPIPKTFLLHRYIYMLYKAP